MAKKKISQMRHKNPQKLSSAIARMHIDAITQCAIKDIVEVKTRIHRVVFFCDCSDKPQGNLYKYFKRKFDNLGVNHDFDPKIRLNGFETQLVVTTNLCQINIFIDSIQGWYPAFQMEVIPKESTNASDFKSYLTELNKLVFNLQPTSVEYTLDLFCEQPREVENLFIMVRRSLFVPYKNNPKIYDNYPEKLDDNSRINSSFSVGDTKIYERGNDDMKTSYTNKYGEIDKGWNYIDLNRLRLEHTANRKKLTDHKIKTLSDLIQNCRFHEINKDLYKFKSFMSKSLPNYWLWSSYSTENEQNCKGAFQLEYVLGKYFQTNLRQYMRDVSEFDVLKERLIQQMLEFDSAWGTVT